MKKASITITICIILVFIIQAKAQTIPFQIALEPITFMGLDGIHSFAYGQHDGKWLIIGGRIDGLHRRQPWATFDTAGQNKNLIVIDPEAQQWWSAPLSSLPVGMQEQLSSTNMEFHQNGEYLYIAGGYGYSNTAADHITYPNLTAVKIPSVINAIINGNSFSAYFRQISDDEFAVTGGYLNKIYDTYYLTGGQRFDGRYNPMNNPSFTQTYTNSIRKFLIVDDGTNLSVTHLVPISDTINLHRRDYNVVPQIMPDGQEGLTAFSGVFQAGADLPFLNCVNIDSSGHEANDAFAQYYNHYHCANIPLYSATANEMHSVFFGGIAQYYDSAGILVQDNNVSFVKTIARVTRVANGTMAEYKLPVEMPALLGAGSEFIRVENLTSYNNEVLRLDEIISDSTLLGYIYGGINSSAPNIFWINNGTQSTASSQIFKVYLVRDSPAGVHELNTQSKGTLRLQLYPNPSDGEFLLNFHLKTITDVKLTIADASGRIMESSFLMDLNPGKNSVRRNLKAIAGGATYFITLETSYEKAMQKLILEN